MKGFAAETHQVAGVSLVVYRRQLDEEEEPEVDPCFFDPGYTVAASTGLAKVSSVACT